MQYTELDERLDLDNQMKELANKYPQNDDDFFMFVRGKESTKEFFLASIGEMHFFGESLFRMALNNNDFKEEFLFAANAVIEYEKTNKNDNIQ